MFPEVTYHCRTRDVVDHERPAKAAGGTLPGTAQSEVSFEPKRHQAGDARIYVRTWDVVSAHAERARSESCQALSRKSVWLGRVCQRRACPWERVYRKSASKNIVPEDGVSEKCVSEKCDSREYAPEKSVSPKIGNIMTEKSVPRKRVSRKNVFRERASRKAPERRPSARSSTRMALPHTREATRRFRWWSQFCTWPRVSQCLSKFEKEHPFFEPPPLLVQPKCMTLFLPFLQPGISHWITYKYTALQKLYSRFELVLSFVRRCEYRFEKELETLLGNFNRGRWNLPRPSARCRLCCCSPCLVEIVAKTAQKRLATARLEQPVSPPQQYATSPAQEHRRPRQAQGHSTSPKPPSLPNHKVQLQHGGGPPHKSHKSITTTSRQQNLVLPMHIFNENSTNERSTKRWSRAGRVGAVSVRAARAARRRASVVPVRVAWDRGDDERQYLHALRTKLADIFLEGDHSF